MRLPSASDAILVVAPHPDDETLCCGGLVHMAVRAGAAVHIAWLTDGDGFTWNARVFGRTLFPSADVYRALGRRRREEARAAAAILGVQPACLHFLGYPDGGLSALAADPAHYERPWRSLRTGAEAVTGLDSISPGAPYSGRALEWDLTSLITHIRPTLVVGPSAADRHADHQAVAALLRRLLASRGQAERLRGWIVHGGDKWPAPKGAHPELPWTVPPRGAGLPWESLTLDAAALDAKRAAIEAHATQVQITPRFMRSCLRASELLSHEN